MWKGRSHKIRVKVVFHILALTALLPACARSKTNSLTETAMKKIAIDNNSTIVCFGFNRVIKAWS